MRLRVHALLCLPFAWMSVTALAADLPVPVRKFVETHCLECHDSQTAEGDFRIDLLGTNLGDEANHKLWARVLERVQ
ncbi:MAG: hypothetical protein HOB20_14800, partial [Planctomycetaceae bacterium]|nr:hypothetical protein [Planctomycetaceae bacterium]